MRVQFLWWEGCPSHPEAWQRLHDVLAGLDVHAEVERIEIKTDDDAEHWRFPGSPTILIDGQDIVAPQAEPVYRLTCRLYFREDGRPSPLPSEATIRRAVQQALARCQDQV